MKEELMAINVWLAGRSYRIKIKPEEESIVRRAVKVADEKITELKAHYAGKDDQDFLAMCLLSYAADTAIDTFANPLVTAELEKLGAKIDGVLLEG